MEKGKCNMTIDIWNDYESMPLPDVLSFIVDNRGKTVPTDENGTHILIATNCIRNENLYPSYDKVRLLNDDIYENWFRAHPLPGDIIFVNKGTPGRVCMVPDPVDFCIAQDMMAFRVNEDIIYNKYLLAVLRNPRIQAQIAATTVGDVIPHFKKQQLGEIRIPIPPMKIQKRIGDLYFMFCAKEECNKKINNNLLEQIKTICSAWLSDYKPFDGVMPSDWVETPLSDVAEFISGYSYKGTELTDSTIAMATIKNFDRKGGFKLDGYKEIIPSSKLKESQHAELFDTLVAHTDLTQNAEVIGNAEPVMSKSGYDDIVFSMDLVKVLPKKDSVSKFLIAAILQDKKFKAHCLGYVNGTTVLHLSKKALPEYKLFLPSDFSTLKPLDEVVTALYKQISSNIFENTYLEELRDTLLPKLMSGELDVSDIEI